MKRKGEREKKRVVVSPWSSEIFRRCPGGGPGSSGTPIRKQKCGKRKGKHDVQITAGIKVQQRKRRRKQAWGELGQRDRKRKKGGGAREKGEKKPNGDVRRIILGGNPIKTEKKIGTSRVKKGIASRNTVAHAPYDKKRRKGKRKKDHATPPKGKRASESSTGPFTSAVNPGHRPTNERGTI